MHNMNRKGSRADVRSNEEKHEQIQQRMKCKEGLSERQERQLVQTNRWLFLRLGLAVALVLLGLEGCLLCIQPELLLHERLAHGSAFLLDHFGNHLLHHGR